MKGFPSDGAVAVRTSGMLYTESKKNAIPSNCSFLLIFSLVILFVLVLILPPAISECL
jgi:hypothetical protein